MAIKAIFYVIIMKLKIFRFDAFFTCINYFIVLDKYLKSKTKDNHGRFRRSRMISKNRKIFDSKAMRKITETQLKIGQVPISNIKIDISCRDEIPQVLLGLQYIDSNKSLRESVFKVLAGIVPRNVDVKNGRPGMDLWKILVLGTLRLNCRWDFDKLHNMANEHRQIREFLGHTIYEFGQTYSLQAIKDNVVLLTPEVLDEISRLVVEAGRALAGEDDIRARCDSFVVETDVHFPTDINLLLDAVRKVLFLIGQECDRIGITEWRQYRFLYSGVRKKFYRANNLKRSKGAKTIEREQAIIDAHREFIDLAAVYVERAKESLSILNELGVGNIARIIQIEHYIGHAERQIDQIRRRVIEGKSIAHHEKVFSIFEEHTEWISKGKAGVPQELGLRVCILEDQCGFILHHHVMERQTDEEIAVLMAGEARRKFGHMAGCSFDKGFYRPGNKEAIGKYVDHVVLPKKGKVSDSERAFENSCEFIKARRKHSAVESGINALENHGLDRCRDHGLYGFERYVALSVLARNIQILGAIIRTNELKRQKRKREKEKLRTAA